jgi:hypothetical protein
MSKIQISNLPPAGAQLSQGGESFLAELKATEAHNIFGGNRKDKCYGYKDDDDCGWRKDDDYGRKDDCCYKLYC